MDYDLTLKQGKGWQSLLHSFVLEGKNLDYYNKTHRELGYVTTPTSLQMEPEELPYSKDGYGTTD